MPAESRPMTHPDEPPPPRPALAARVLRVLLRHRVRGSWRLATMLPRHLRSLQAVPIAIEDAAPVYMDLRVPDALPWLIDAPWPTSPLEPGEQAVMRRLVRPGDVALDVGANIGLHTTLMARLVGEGGRVVAFEPSAEILPCLRRTVAALPNVSLHEIALADAPGEARLFVHPEHPTMTSLGDWTKLWDEAAATHTIACTRRRLDDLVDEGRVPRPDFVKIDVEGAEALVCRGARRTLDREDAPALLFEENLRASATLGLAIAATREWLADMPRPGYRFFELSADGELAPFDSERLDAPDAPRVRNVVALPRARLDAL